MSTFSTVKRFPFVICTEASPLAFNARLVYSYLVYRYRKKLPGPATKIGADTGLCRVRTVPDALQELASHGLVRKPKDGWRACEPEGKMLSWFSLRRDAGPRKLFYDWFRYQMYPYPGPDCPLTPRQLYLYGLLVSLMEQNKPVIADKYLRKLSGLDLATVSSARRKLFSLGLVVDAPGGWKLASPEKFFGWFVPVNGESGQDERSSPAQATEVAFSTEANAVFKKQEALERLIAPKVERFHLWKNQLLRFPDDILRQVVSELTEPVRIHEFEQRCHALQDRLSHVSSPVALPASEDDFLARLDAEESTKEHIRVELEEEKGDSLIPKGLAADLLYRKFNHEDLEMLRPALIAASTWAEDEEEDHNL